MSNKVKVPGGAFYAGDGLTVDPITRTVSVQVVVFTENSDVVSCNCSYEKFKEIVESGQAFVFYIRDNGDGAIVLQSSQVVVSNSNNGIASTFSMANGSSASYVRLIYRSDGTITIEAL